MIRIENLKKSFDNNVILENVNLHVEKQDALVIIGGSGCGKSTLLRCINRLETPDSGHIYVNGRDIMDKSFPIEELRRKIGIVYQDFNLFSHLNVMENMILAPMKVLGLTKSQAMAQADDLLEMVGMESRRYNMPQTLSGGQKQRVAIARAMAMRPEVLLFDEPTSALDPSMSDEVQAVIRRLVQNGMTSVIVTHEMRFARNIASKVVFLAEKGIYEQGSAEEIFERPAKELTRQFFYRSRMLTRTVTMQDSDIFAMNSEIRAFASPYGFNKDQGRGLDYIGEELILPVMKACGNPDVTAEINFIANDEQGPHQMIIAFSGTDGDPLQSEALDELNFILLRNFTKELSSKQTTDGKWEVKALI